MRRTLALLVVSTAVGSHADGYTYVEGAYTRASLDDFPEEANGLWATGSYEATGWLHLWATAGYFATDMSQSGLLLELDSRDASAGVGLHADVAPSISVFGRAGLGRVESEVRVSGGFLDEPGRFTEDEDGVVASVGIWFRVLPAVELQATLHAASYHGETDESIWLDARYDMTEHLTAVGRVAIHQDAEVFNVGLRVNF